MKTARKKTTQFEKKKITPGVGSALNRKKKRGQKTNPAARTKLQSVRVRYSAGVVLAKKKEGKQRN